jgi:hypothetical protein
MAKRRKKTVNGQTVRTTSAKRTSTKKKSSGTSERRSEKLSGLSGPALGTYDPALDVELRSSRRGLSDLIFDTRRGKRLRHRDIVTALALLQRGRNRESQDLGIDFGRGMRDIGIASERGTEDIGSDRDELLRDYARTMGDYDTAEGRATEDFDYAGRKIERQYAQLGSAQNQDINARGLLNSGAAAAAAEKRAGNKAFQFEPIQTAFNRQLEEVGTGRTRATEDRDVGLADLARSQARLDQDVGLGRGDLTQDYGLATTRLGQDYTTQRGQGLRDYRRSNREDKVNLSRARREGAIFETDILAKKFFDAAQRDPSLRYGMTKFLTGPKGTKQQTTQQQQSKKRRRRR